MTASQFPIAGVCLVFVAVVILAARRRRPAGRAGLFAADASEFEAHKLERLVADLQEISRDHLAKLDDRIQTLRGLLAEADDRIRRREHLVDLTIMS